jgi:hypothetical protein
MLRGATETLEDAQAAVLADPAASTVAACTWNLWTSCIPRGAEATAHHAFASNGEIFVQVILQGDILEVFFDQRYSLSTRIGRGGRSFGLFAREGRVAWRDLVIRRLD